MARATRTVLLVSLCYALSVSTIAVNLAIAPLVGLRLAPSPAWATLPVSLQVLATMGASFPVAMFMGRFGRRAGHLATTLVGLASAALAAWAIAEASFVLFCVGTAGMGVLNSAAQQYRFAAADVAEDWRPRAIAYVLAGGLVAGVVGPFVAVQGADLLATEYVGSYVAVVGLYALAGLLVLALRLPPPSMETGERPPRPMAVIARQPRFIAAVLAAMMAYGGMALIMTGTPIAMRAEGFSLSASARVIQLHILAMFAPSFVMGGLITQFGARRIILAGMAAFGVTLAVGLSGATWWHHAIALIALGIGWNAMFTAGTTMVTEVHRRAEQAKVQGVNDLFVFGAAATGSFLAGYLHDAAGWEAMNLVLVPVVVLAGVAWWLARTGAVPAP